MSFDFTLDKYHQLCEAAINAQYAILTVEAYLTTQNRPPKCIILRHDVDRNPERAWQMAIMENNFGIKASYYFRHNKKVFQPKIIREIAKLGHEIGYHYEVLDKAKYNQDRAIKIFEYELSEFRKIAEVKTICMHGNPLTKWDNRDLWNKYDFRDFGLIGEAYLSFDNITYFSDTGRTWGAKHKVKDRFVSDTHKNNKITNNTGAGCTDDIIRLIEKGQLGCAYLVAHPHRWNGNLFDWAITLVFDTAINLVKSMLGLTKRSKAGAN